MAVGFLFLVLHKESDFLNKKPPFYITMNKRALLPILFAGKPVPCNTAQYTKVYETGPSSRVVREAAFGAPGLGTM